MFAQAPKMLILPALAGIFVSLSLAQTTAIEGDVKDENGQLLKDAIVKIERKDIKGSYKTKSDKKGHYFHAGLPLGTYKVILEINGQERDNVDNVRPRMGDPLVVNFNLQAQVRRQQTMAKAAETGQLTEEQKREMSPEQKAALEKRAKESQAAMAKNKALNDAFNAAMEAKNAKNWAVAVQGFEKAAELDAAQHVVWANLGDAYSNRAKEVTGDEQQTALDKSNAAFQRAIELKPDDAGYHNNYALQLAQAKKFAEAQAELTKAAQLDPTNAGKYYFNLGAVLVNTGQTDAAAEAFKKALEVDPNYADAYYQYGISLMGKASVSPDGKIVGPAGTREAFEKYLALRPEGRDAEAAKEMIRQLGGTVETEFNKPGSKKAQTKKKQ